MLVTKLGESERYLKHVFQHACTLPRAIIFFDEFDSIAMTRRGADEGSQVRFLCITFITKYYLQYSILVCNNDVNFIRSVWPDKEAFS